MIGTRPLAGFCDLEPVGHDTAHLLCNFPHRPRDDANNPADPSPDRLQNFLDDVDVALNRSHHAALSFRSQ